MFLVFYLVFRLARKELSIFRLPISKLTDSVPCRAVDIGIAAHLIKRKGKLVWIDRIKVDRAQAFAIM